MTIESRKYKDHWKLFQIKLIGEIDYLSSIPFTIRESIHYKFTVENIEKGANIFTKGAECQAIYIVISG